MRWMLFVCGYTRILLARSMAFSDYGSVGLNGWLEFMMMFRRIYELRYFSEVLSFNLYPYSARSNALDNLTHELNLESLSLL